MKKLQSSHAIYLLNNDENDNKTGNHDNINTSSFHSSILNKSRPKLIIRTDGKGYPFITENGNIIIDIHIPNIINIEKTEYAIKNIPGVLEVGLFSRKKNTKYYAVNSDGNFSIKSTT
jgi:ribose 5-phosphate isomerase